jgi:hypothetical protein
MSVSSFTTSSPLHERIVRALSRLTRGGLAAFILFSALLGVREARAQTAITVGGCVAACSAMFLDFKSSAVCAGCLVWAAIELHNRLGGDRPLEGYACAKANMC